MSENHKCTICKKSNCCQEMNIFGFKKSGCQYKTCINCRAKRRKNRAEVPALPASYVAETQQQEEEQHITTYTHQCSSCRKIRICPEATIFGYKKNGAETCFSCRSRKKRKTRQIQEADPLNVETTDNDISGTTTGPIIHLHIQNDNGSTNSDQLSNFYI